MAEGDQMKEKPASTPNSVIDSDWRPGYMRPRNPDTAQNVANASRSTAAEPSEIDYQGIPPVIPDNERIRQPKP